MYLRNEIRENACVTMDYSVCIEYGMRSNTCNTRSCFICMEWDKKKIPVPPEL
jgi:hypothetical protein